MYIKCCNYDENYSVNVVDSRSAVPKHSAEIVNEQCNKSQLSSND